MIPYKETTAESTKKSISRKGRKGKVGERNWTKDEIENHIRLREQSKIYNVSLPNYLDKKKKSKVVKEISAERGISVDEITKNMASLRSYYCQLQSNHKTAKMKSRGKTSDVKNQFGLFSMC